jgi:hypothetical protein
MSAKEVWDWGIPRKNSHRQAWRLWQLALHFTAAKRRGLCSLAIPPTAPP